MLNYYMEDCNTPKQFAFSVALWKIVPKKNFHFMHREHKRFCDQNEFLNFIIYKNDSLLDYAFAT